MEFPKSPSRRTATLFAGLVATIALVVGVYTVPVPFVTMRPGPTYDTLGEFDGAPMFTFADDVRTYPADGQIHFTTISVTRAESSITFAAALGAWLDDDVEVVPHEFVYPDEQSNEESAKQSQAALTSSKDNSRAAALRAAGFEVGEEAVIAEVQEGAPALGKLQAGDVLVAIDGQEIADPDEAGTRIADREPGDPVNIAFRRGDAVVEETIVTGAMPDDEKRPRIGVLISRSYDFPVEIENNVGDTVGGPSAGMMFALAIYDRLTPGSLTAGRHIAGTGTVNGDGQVGPIGGVRQKIAGAKRDGAEVFLLPASLCDEATAESVDDIKLIPMTSLSDAVSSLEAIAKDPKAKVPTCS